MSSSYQKFAKDVFTVGIGHVLVALQAIIVLPLITKTLGAHNYGVWAQFHVTLGLALSVAGLGLQHSLLRFLPAKTTKEEIQDDFYSALCLASVSTAAVSLGIIVAAESIAAAFFDGATEIVRIAGAVIFVASLNQVLFNLFGAFRQMTRYSVFRVADSYVALGLIAYLVLQGHGVVSLVIAVLVTKVAIFSALFFLGKRQIGVTRPHFRGIREYLHFGIFIIPATMCTWVVESSDRLIIGYVLEAASVGIYSAAYAVGNILILIVAVIGFVLIPTLSKLYDEGNIGEVKQHLSYTLKYFLAVAIPFVFGSAVLAEPVLRTFSTPDMATEGRLIVPLVALGVLLYGLSMVIPQGLPLARRTRLIGAIWTIAAICNISLNVLLVPRMGIEAAAITTVIAYSVVLGLGAYYSWKELTFTIDWRFIGKSILASLLMSLAVWKMPSDETATTVLAVIAGVAVYGTALLLLKAFDRGEFAFFKGLFRGK